MNPCIWTYNEADDFHETSCGNGHQFTTGGVAENKYVFCPYCGGKIEQPEDAK